MDVGNRAGIVRHSVHRSTSTHYTESNALDAFRGEVTVHTAKINGLTPVDLPSPNAGC